MLSYQVKANQSVSSIFRLSVGLIAIVAGGMIGVVLVWLNSPIMVLAGLVALIAGIIMAFNVDLGLLAMIFVIFIRLSDVMVNEHGLPSIAKPFIGLLIVGIAIRWVLYNQPPRGWGWSFFLIFVYGLTVSLSLIYAQDYTRASDATSDFLKDGLVCVMVVMILQKEKVFHHVAWAMVCAGAFLGTISMIQYFTGSYDNAYWGFGLSKLASIVSGTSDYRISGPYGDPNFYAQAMVVFVPISLDRFMGARRTFPRSFALWALLVSSFTIIVTFSRGGFLSLVTVLTIFAVWKGLSFKNWVLILSLITIGILLLPDQYSERLGTLTSFLPGSDQTAQSEASFTGRLSENIIAVRMFMDHPILGVGFKNYPAQYLEYSRGLGIDQRRVERSPHSLYLEIAAEHGLLGLLIFGFLLYNVFKGLIDARKIFTRLHAFEMDRLSMAILISLVGYLVSAIFLHGAYPRPFWMLIGLSLAFSAYAQVQSEIHYEEKLKISRRI